MHLLSDATLPISVLCTDNTVRQPFQPQICWSFHERAQTMETARFLSMVLLCGTVCQLTCAHQISQRTFTERN